MSFSRQNSSCGLWSWGRPFGHGDGRLPFARFACMAAVSCSMNGLTHSTHFIKWLEASGVRRRGLALKSWCQVKLRQTMGGLKRFVHSRMCRRNLRYCGSGTCTLPPILFFARSRVVGHLRGTRLNHSEFIFCTVCSVSTFSAVLDSLEHADSGKNCLVKLFNVYLEMSGVLSGGRICHDHP